MVLQRNKNCAQKRRKNENVYSVNYREKGVLGKTMSK